MTTSRKLDREQQDEHILEVRHGQLSFMLLKETVLRGWFSLPNCRGHYRCKALCFWRFIGLFFPEEYISFCCVKLSFGAKLTHHWHGYSISCRWKKFSFFKTFFHLKPKWQIRFPVPFRQLPVKRFFVDILMMDMAVWNSSLGGFENNMVRLLPNQHGRLAVCFILLRESLRLFVSQLMIDMPTQNHVRLDARWNWLGAQISFVNF